MEGPVRRSLETKSFWFWTFWASWIVALGNVFSMPGIMIKFQYENWWHPKFFTCDSGATHWVDVKEKTISSKQCEMIPKSIWKIGRPLVRASRIVWFFFWNFFFSRLCLFKFIICLYKFIYMVLSRVRHEFVTSSSNGTISVGKTNSAVR